MTSVASPIGDYRRRDDVDAAAGVTPPASPPTLDAAYAECERITRVPVCLPHS